MSHHFVRHEDRHEIYAMVSFGHKERKEDKNSSFFFPVYVGMIDAAMAIDPSIKIEWHGPLAWDPEPEATAIRELTARQVDGIIVTAADAEALNPAINDAIQAGIPVINFDADSPASERLTFVGTNNFEAGYLAGTAMAQWLNGEGDVMVASIAHAAHLDARLQGFQMALSQLAPYAAVYVTYEFASTGADETLEEMGRKYRKVSRRMFQAHPTIRGTFVTFAGVAPDVAIMAEKLLGRNAVQVLAFDVDSRIVDFLINKRLRGVVEQDTYLMGYVSMVLAYAARHAAIMPNKYDGCWRIPALRDFLTTHPNIPGTIARKLRNILARLEIDPMAVLYLDVKIFNKEHILKVFIRDFERMRESLSDKITSLGEEIAIRKQSEEQYRVLAEQVKNGILIIQERTIVFANKAFRKLIGEPLPQPLTLDRFFTLFQKSVEASETLGIFSEPWEMETPTQLEWCACDGRVIWTEIEQFDIVWNAQPALLLTVRDITHSKQREQRLEQERLRLQQENLSYKSTIMDRYRFGPLIGKSSSMRRVYELIVMAAASDVNVLLIGESGTGKELIARTIHQVGIRKDHAFVPVNCASIPELLFEREFFGHRKGAFTGAIRNHPGILDRAHQGILFLDEVTELSPAMQAKLLRVLQDGEYIPLGSNQPKQANILIVAATNKNYRSLIEQKLLREDFFYRICVLEIAVPPLRERKEDIPLLIEHILEQYRRKYAGLHGENDHVFPEGHTMLPGGLVEALHAYQWPGNIRELQNVLYRYVATQDLEAVLTLLGYTLNNHFTAMPFEPHYSGLSLPEAVEALEKQMITEALAKMNNNRSQAARALNLPRRTLYMKLKKYRFLHD